MSKEAQSIKPAQNPNIPPNVIANAARFNKQFLDSQLGGNPTTVSIGKMLTVMSEQDNTIRVLSRILGRDYNEQHLHDMHNSLFGDIASGSSSGREGNASWQCFNSTNYIHTRAKSTDSGTY
jgi:hypothetical protein